jgi:flavin reductase (DIM6/NTAB) family NADH-FMN oxidoreductase RutF
LARRFATPLADRFDGVALARTEDGLPVIDGAAANLICSIASHVDAGDHRVVFGQVHRIVSADRDPLVVYRSAFGTFQDATQ